jgi:1-acyl-sn-glycerol-3-phosphate acyltransferase
MRLRKTFDYCWRLFATGFCFACFGLGGVLLSLSLFPLIRLLTWDRDSTRRRIQRAMQWSFRVFVWQMTTLGVISYEISGRERLAGRGQLIVANHPSLIDVVLLIALLPQVDCIVKEALWRNPFLRGPVSWADYTPNRGSAEDLVAAAAAKLRQGRSLIVFPEGTRSVPGQPLQLQRGAARIALAAQAQLLPVTIVCEPIMLTKADPWYRIPPRRGHWRLVVGEPMAAARFQAGEVSEALAARHLTEYLLQYFSRSMTAITQRARSVAVPLTPDCTMQ